MIGMVAPMLMTLPPNGSFDSEAFAFIVAIYVAIALIVLVPVYIIQAVGLYSIASRRGIPRPWLAWVPVGDAWILGRISDQYQQAVHGAVKNRGKILLVLQAASSIAYIAEIVLIFTGFAGLEETATEVEAFLALAPALVVLLVMIGLSVTTTIFGFLAKYDLFRSCDPKNATVYLIACLVVQFIVPSLSILQQILVLLCRNKDDGMPKPQPEIPPAEPWQPN